MKDLWARLEAWAQIRAKRSLRLRPGAGERAVKAAEKTMKMTFPDDFRASVLAHDGQEPGRDTFAWLPGCRPLMTLDEIVDGWKSEEKRGRPRQDKPEPGPYRTLLWHPKRIPLDASDLGVHTYIDLFPGDSGTAGQILTFVSECELAILGPSMRAALETYVGGLEIGDWVWRRTEIRPKQAKKGDYWSTAEVFAAYQSTLTIDEGLIAPQKARKPKAKKPNK
jgi:cell wall assembly regulator SMI1